MKGYFQSHCCRPSSAFGYTNLIGNGSRLHCGSREAGARSPHPEPSFRVELHRCAYSRFLAAIALAWRDHRPGDCFFAATPPINGQSQKFRLLCQNSRRSRLDDLENL
jgi:hypothetical protein